MCAPLKCLIHKSETNTCKERGKSQKKQKTFGQAVEGFLRKLKWLIYRLEIPGGGVWFVEFKHDELEEIKETKS